VAFFKKVKGRCLLQAVKNPSEYTYASYMGISNTKAKVMYKKGLIKLQKSIDFYNAYSGVFGTFNCCSNCGLEYSKNSTVCDDKCNDRLLFYEKNKKKYPIRLVEINPNKFWNMLKDKECRKYLNPKILDRAKSLERNLL
jgi:hypothetical protein